MTQNSANGVDMLSLTYSFSPRETALLAHFLRDHQEIIPDGLADFSKAVETAVYNAMSIEEAEKFYS